MLSHDEQLATLRRENADLKAALTAARQTAEAAHQAAQAARDSAARAWLVSSTTHADRRERW